MAEELKACAGGLRAAIWAGTVVSAATARTIPAVAVRISQAGGMIIGPAELMA